MAIVYSEMIYINGSVWILLKNFDLQKGMFFTWSLQIVKFLNHEYNSVTVILYFQYVIIKKNCSQDSIVHDSFILLPECDTNTKFLMLKKNMVSVVICR